MAVGAEAGQPVVKETQLEFRITLADMSAFRRLSGDTNPLHDDAAFARRCGFDDVVVYGGLIVAQVSRLLGTLIPGPGCVWRSLTFKFRNPLYVGVRARLRASVVYSNETFRLVRLKLRVEAANVLIAEGEAEAQLAAAASERSAVHAIQ
jgi:3-hydroxybutyryl-CoA dehydratase